MNIDKTKKDSQNIKAENTETRLVKLADTILTIEHISRIRKAAELTQYELADILGLAQPSLSLFERQGQGMRLSTLSRYIEGVGGKATLNVTLPNGKQLTFNL